MDDDIILQPDKVPPSPAADETTSPDSVDGGTDPQNEDDTGDRVFDISADLNISPLKDADVADKPAPAHIDVPPVPRETSKPPAEVTALKPAEKIATSSTSPVVDQSSLEPGINQLRQPARPIPMQDFPMPLGQVQRPFQQAPMPVGYPSPDRTAPANPPAKTLGSVGPVPAAVHSTPPVSRSHKQFAVPSSGNIKPIRTFESDIAEAIALKKASTASIAIAERSKSLPEKRIVNTPVPTSHSTRNFILLLLSICLIAGGIFGGYYLYQQSPLALSRQTTPTPPPIRQALITADSQVELPIDYLNRTAVLAKIRTEIAASQNPNSIKEIIPVTNVRGQRTDVTAAAMVSLMNIPVPDILNRSLDAPWMLGVYEDPAGTKDVFVVTTNTFFQNAFAGMLQWENLMPTDLNPFLNTTPTSNVSGHFVDRIIANHDVREYISDSGRILFLYSFIDTQKLVITDSEAALGEILTRLENQSFMR
ncbi:MAG: hypothetical protein KGI59_02465 [Patescibacteria group bacterium]|nr:hypothetical protein [Patescibacteria group bacterium]